GGGEDISVGATLHIALPVEVPGAVLGQSAEGVGPRQQVGARLSAVPVDALPDELEATFVYRERLLSHRFGLDPLSGVRHDAPVPYCPLDRSQGADGPIADDGLGEAAREGVGT